MKRRKATSHRPRRKHKLSTEEQASVAKGDASEALTRIKKSEERIEMLEQYLERLAKSVNELAEKMSKLA